MSSKKEIELISGFTRQNTTDLRTLYDYPADINDIILMYFSIEMLEWEITDKISNKYQFVINDRFKNNEIQSTSGHKDVVCIAKKEYVISATLYNKFYFEVQLIDFKPHSLDCVIGYVQYPLNPKLVRNPRYFLGGKGEQSLYVSAFNNYFEVYSNYRRIKSLKHKSISNEFEINDRIGIEFNFITKKSLLHYNGFCVGIISDSIPNKIIPAISLFHRDITVLCSQWKVIEYAKM